MLRGSCGTANGGLVAATSASSVLHSLPNMVSPILVSPPFVKARLLVFQNYQRWLFELLMLCFTTLSVIRRWHSCLCLLLFVLVFETAVLRSRRIRHLRNSNPTKLYLGFVALFAILCVLLEGYLFEAPVFFHTFSLLGWKDGGSAGKRAGVALLSGGSIPAPPAQFLGQNGIDRSAVIVKNGEAVRAPFSRLLDATFQAVADSTTVGARYVTGDDLSIIIPVRNEAEYLSKTIMYTVQNTARQYIREFIVVDDASTEPIADVLDRELPRNIRGLVKVLRYDTKEGLIRARIAGADLASSTNIFFLDGHCRPKQGWAEPLIRHLKTNYKRIACPVIQDISAKTWEDTGTSGFKMMFEWNFEFGWYDDLTDEVPLSAGGILAMTKKWWQESGKYDSGMLEWGGENIEQSIRIWLCGGEIYVVRNSKIGHIFDRPAKPNPENQLVMQVQKNQKRAALVWLDDYYKFFEKHHPIVKSFDPGPGLEDRVALRRVLKCMPFQWYVDKFRTAFERKGLLDAEYMHIQHQRSRWCMAVVGPNPAASDDVQKKHHHVVLMPCDQYNPRQQWQAVGGRRLLYHKQTGKCLDSFAGQSGSPTRDKRPIVYECDWNGVFQLANRNQFWQFDYSSSNRVFTYFTNDIATLTGSDVFMPDPKYGHNPKSLCLSADLPAWSAWDWTHDEENFQAHNRYERDVYYVPCKPPNETLEWADCQKFYPLWYGALQ